MGLVPVKRGGANLVNELTSQAEAGGHPAEDVAHDPLAVERVLVEETERAHDERVRERRRVPAAAAQVGVGVLRGGGGGGVWAPDGEAEEEEELGEGRVEERERDVREPAGATGGERQPAVSRITPGRRREKRSFKGDPKEGEKGRERVCQTRVRVLAVRGQA